MDFVLNLQDKLGDTDDEVDAKKIATTFDANAMFQNTVFGDNTTVVIGDNNATTIKNSVKNGDFNSLAEVLRQNGIAEDDVKSLEAAIGNDKDLVDVHKKTFGPSVKNWISKMMDKAVNAAWNIELGVAGSLLASALQHFYFS